MWKACLRVVKEQARQAKHVLDRFHIVQKLGKAIDKLRAAEAKRLKAQGEEPVLKSSRWLLLKRPERLTEKQEPKLAELLQLNLRTVRAFSSGAVEGMNNKAKVALRTAYGFRSYKACELVL